MTTKSNQEETRETSFIQIAWRGMAMGIAEVIPGVSGGTIAFITGIYKRLLNAISGVAPGVSSLFKKGGIPTFWKEVDGNFLAFLFVGMLMGIGIGVFGVSHLLETNPEILWSFFFGLIIASTVFIIKSIESFNTKTWIAFALGALFAYAVTAMYPMQGSDNLFLVFCAGTIAICALILPGVSGSFMLLIMGMYSLIVGSLRNFLAGPNFDDFATVAVFAVGCLIGLLSFARIVNRLFDKYPKITLATLAGFMLGSIHKIWPWRNPSVIFDKEKGELAEATDIFTNLSEVANNEQYKIVMDINVLPEGYHSDPKTMMVVIAAIFGFLLVTMLTSYKSKPTS